LKVLFVADYFWPFIGGAEISSLITLTKLAQMGLDVSVLSHRFPNWAPYESHDGLEIHRENLYVGKTQNTIQRTIFYIRSAFMVLKYIRKEKPNVVIAQQLVSIPTTLVSRVLRIPIIVIVRDYWPICYYRFMMKPDGSICSTYDKCFKDMFICARNSFTHRLKKSKLITNILALQYPFQLALHTAVTKRIIKKANIITTSNFVRYVLETNGFDPGKIRVVYNPVSTEAVSESDSGDSFCVLFVGALEFAKGLETLLRAMSQVCCTVKEAKLLIAGDGPQKAYFQALAEKLGIKDRCKFYGQILEDEIVELYKSCGVVVVPSIWPEPFGRAVIEAMSFNKPVIASNVGGIPEIVNEKVGIVVPPGNSRSLAVAIISVLTKEAAFEPSSDMEKFSPENVARQYLDIIQDVHKMRLKSVNQN
jgi:glycosyltransferase involved in cell wall biosynthesis